MLRVAVVVGHRESAQGAVSVDGTTEWVWAKQHARALVRELAERGVPADIVIREDTGSGYGRLPSKINALKPDACVCLHFNAHSNPSAHGSEVLYWHTSAAGRRLAMALGKADNVLRLRNRGKGGVVAVDEEGRGAWVLQRTNMPCVITEPAFGSNAADWAALVSGGGKLAKAQADALAGYLGA